MLLEIVLKTYFPIGKEGRGGLGSMYRRLVFFSVQFRVFFV